MASFNVNKPWLKPKRSHVDPKILGKPSNLSKLVSLSKPKSVEQKNKEPVDIISHRLHVPSAPPKNLKHLQSLAVSREKTTKFTGYEEPPKKKPTSANSHVQTLAKPRRVTPKREHEVCLQESVGRTEVVC